MYAKSRGYATVLLLSEHRHTPLMVLSESFPKVFVVACCFEDSAVDSSGEVTGPGIQDPGSRILKPELWTLDAESWTLGPVHWVLHP